MIKKKVLKLLVNKTGTPLSDNQTMEFKLLLSDIILRTTNTFNC